MVRKIEAEERKSLKIIGGKVKKIFSVNAKPSGNGAIVYIPRENINDENFVVICK